MTEDERAIRKLVDTWFTASKTGDLSTVLSLMMISPHRVVQVAY